MLVFFVWLTELPGFELRVNLSASEILNLAERIIAKSKKVHDAVASVPPNKVLTLFLLIANFWHGLDASLIAIYD